MSKLRYIFDAKEEQAVHDYLHGELTSRALGKALGISNQAAINMLPKVIRDWIKDKRYKLIKNVEEGS